MNGLFGLLFENSAAVWHGVLVALGIALAVAAAMVLRKMQNENMWDIPVVALGAIVVGMLLSRIYYSHFAKQSLPDDNSIFNITDGGNALYGGALGLLLVAVAYGAFMKLDIGKLLDAISPAAMIAVVFGRVASIFTGEDIGIDVSGTVFEGTSLAQYDNRFNAEIFLVYIPEIVVGYVIVLALFTVFIKGRKNKNSVSGDICLLMLLLYGCTQTLFESMRTDSLFLLSIGFVRISQVVSIILATISYVIFSVRSAKKNGVIPQYIVLWVCSLIFIAVSFYMEFTMTKEAFERNTFTIAFGLLCYMIVGVYFCICAQRSGEKAREEKKSV